MTAKILAVTNQKGGVGKTTSSCNVAKELCSRNKRVLLVDNDPQGNQTKLIFGDDIPEEIFYIDDQGKSRSGPANSYTLYEEGREVEPYRVSDYLSIFGTNKKLAGMNSEDVIEVGIPFKEKLTDIAQQFDYIIIDCLPGWGTLLNSALLTSDYVLIPTELDGFAVDGIAQLYKTVGSVKKHLNPGLQVLGIFANKVDGRRVQVQRHYKQDIRERFGDAMLEHEITASVKVAEANALNQSVAEYMPTLTQTHQYQRLATEILERMEG
ncbi:ParA family protein [Endozoicomonas lisbonensis]|uniref:Chromosome partitioning protein n=1 Tax=Endozoicomonas lisbonensis TaxID=3120522 RepID=A0ABV2SCM5_9GAMM